MNLYTFSYGIIHWLVDLVNHLWYWLGDFLPWWFGDFFDDVGNFAASHGHIAVMAILVEVLIIIVIAHFVFSVSIVGNWFLLLGFLLLGILAFISIGYLALSRAGSLEGAQPIIQLIQFPMLFLSGIFFPVEIMPDFMRPVVNAMPLTYLGDALR